MPAGVPTPALARRRSATRWTLAVAVVAAGLWIPDGARAQRVPADEDLRAASGGRVVRLGSASNAGPVVSVPIEVYVARVVAGEADARAADPALEALAIAARTFVAANGARHARDGFDLCDGTHCQVPRAATPATRRAAMTTAARILTYEGAVAQVFYSASCGGSTESAEAVWPGARVPYLKPVRDEVHDADEPWTLELTAEEVERALAPAGVEGRVRDLRVESRSASGRAATLRLSGMRPAVLTGDRFRAAVGAARLRSTAFSVEPQGRSWRFTGRGYGHGVGLCVVGAGRRAARGESAVAILGTYFPDLEIEHIARVRAR